MVELETGLSFGQNASLVTNEQNFHLLKRSYQLATRIASPSTDTKPDRESFGSSSSGNLDFFEFEEFHEPNPYKQ